MSSVPALSTNPPEQRPEQRPTVVTTSLQAVQRDTRIFQIGASIRRLGYRSIVVETERSSLDHSDLPFELIVTPDAQPAAVAELPEATRTSEVAGTPEAAQSTEAEPPAPMESDSPRSHPLVEMMPGPISGALKRLGAALLRLRTGLPKLPHSQARKYLRMQRESNGQLAETLPAADLYYLNFFSHFPAVWEACKRHDAPLIYESQDAHWEWPGYQALPVLYRAWLRILERRCVRRAEVFISVSDGVADSTSGATAGARRCCATSTT